MFIILFGKQKSILFFLYAISTLVLELPEVSIFDDLIFNIIN